MNRLELLAEVVEREPLRYTPAGIPIVSATLRHESSQVEAALPRQVTLEISAVAAGEIAGRFNQVEAGARYRFHGFITRKNRNSRSIVFHIEGFEPYSIDHQTGANDGIR